MLAAGQDVLEFLESAVERAKPQGSLLAYHPVRSGQPGSGAFMTIHVVTHDGCPLDDSFDFSAVVKELGKPAKAKVEDRKVYSQQIPVPYKVITGTLDGSPLEIVFLLATPAAKAVGKRN